MNPKIPLLISSSFLALILFANCKVSLLCCFSIWDNYHSYSPPIIAFWGASRRRIWTKIGGNESQDLPGPPYSPQNPRCWPENLKNNNNKIQQKKTKNQKIRYDCLISPNDSYPRIRMFALCVLQRCHYKNYIFLHLPGCWRVDKRPRTW